METIQYLHAFGSMDGLSTLLEETARQRLDALPLEVAVAQVAALEAAKLLALSGPPRTRLVPGEELPASAKAERIVQMDSAERLELLQRLQERLAAEA